MKWISVRCRLPNNAGQYLIVSQGDVIIGDYEYNKWTTASYDDNPYVTHWMQLPKPPKGAK